MIFTANAVPIFFDLEKAYKSTWKFGIMRDLHNAGLRGRLPLFIESFLKKETLPNFFGCSPGPDPANFGPKRWVFGKLIPNPICIPNLKLLASMVAKIRRGSHFFGCTPSPDPRQYWSKTLFSVKLVPNPICVPNLKLLASTVAKIRRESQFFYACDVYVGGKVRVAKLWCLRTYNTVDQNKTLYYK